jgi:hypothetical protein
VSRRQTSWVLLAVGLAWPYLVVSALTAAYAFTGLDLPDPPWWSAGACLALALGLVPLGLGARARLGRGAAWLLWAAALALADALGVALYMALLNVALSLPLG